MPLLPLIRRTPVVNSMKWQMNYSGITLDTCNKVLIKTRFWMTKYLLSKNILVNIRGIMGGLAGWLLLAVLKKKLGERK